MGVCVIEDVDLLRQVVRQVRSAAPRRDMYRACGSAEVVNPRHTEHHGHGPCYNSSIYDDLC